MKDKSVETKAAEAVISKKSETESVIDAHILEQDYYMYECCGDFYYYDP